MILDNSIEEPLYLQLYETLKKDITNNVYKPGERFPTEKGLVNIYQVSRITVRNALEKLARENYLTRHRGRGTFVTNVKYPRSLTKHMSFTEMCRSIHCEPGAKTIKSVIEDATAEDISELNISKGSKVIVLERIRYMNGTPVSVETERYVETYDFLLDVDLNNKSLYQILNDTYSITLVRSSRHIEIAFASYQLAKYLNVIDGYPLLLMYGVIYDNRGLPACRSRQYIVGDKFSLVL